MTLVFYSLDFFKEEKVKFTVENPELLQGVSFWM